MKTRNQKRWLWSFFVLVLVDHYHIFTGTFVVPCCWLSW